MVQEVASAGASQTSRVALTRHQFSTDSPSRYAAIDHSEAYEAAMQGPHGQQLALARLEGAGKDDPLFDPFLEEEMAALGMEDDEEFDDEEYSDNVVEAELVGDEDEEEFEDSDDIGPYNPDGSVRRQKSVLATLRAGFPAGGLFAVIEMGGSQFKITTDDLIVVNRLKPTDKYKTGSVHTLKDVMLVGSSHTTLVGMPHVPGAEVDVMVEEITRDAKVIIFKKRRRKNSQRKNGFRRDVTLLRVLDVRLPAEYKDRNFVERGIVDELVAESTQIIANQPTKTPISDSSKADEVGLEPSNRSNEQKL